MNSGTHTRSIAFPLGWKRYFYMDIGDILAGRSAVLALLAWGMGAMPVLEQPRRSMMTALPSWQHVIGYFDQAEKRGWKGQRIKMNPISMACFKAPTLKPTALYSTESLDPLINMKVPPKDQRPQAEAEITYQCHGFNRLWVVVWSFPLYTRGFWTIGPPLLSRYTNANGETKVVGGPGLKQSQMYTAEFGRGMASWWMVHGPISTGTAGVFHNC